MVSWFSLRGLSVWRKSRSSFFDTRLKRSRDDRQGWVTTVTLYFLLVSTVTGGCDDRHPFLLLVTVVTVGVTTVAPCAHGPHTFFLCGPLVLRGPFSFLLYFMHFYFICTLFFFLFSNNPCRH